MRNRKVAGGEEQACMLTQWDLRDESYPISPILFRYHFAQLGQQPADQSHPMRVSDRDSDSLSDSFDVCKRPPAELFQLLGVN